MLTRFRVKNFKNLVDCGFEPQPVSAVIGPNGCGKSSLLQAVDFLRAFFMSSVELYLQEKGWSFRDLPNLRQTTKKIEWEIAAELDDGGNDAHAGTYEYSISLSPRRYLAIGQESLYYTRKPSPGQTPAGAPRECLLARTGRKVRVLNRRTAELSSETVIGPASYISGLDPSRDRAAYPELLRLREWVERFRCFLVWDPKVLRSPDRKKHKLLGPSGEHLAPILALLRLEHPDRYRKLMKRMLRLFPHVSDISVTGGRSWGWRRIRLHERDNGEDVVFNSQQMSDGVLRMLALMSLLYVDRPPSLVMLEEPEDGVHPQLLREMVQVLRELTLRKPPNRSQVIFTTHSPYVLDEFYDSPDEVLVMERHKPKSGATLSALSGASQLANVRRHFDKSLGEAWFSGLIGGTAGSR